ncbi:putative translation elongation factor EF1B/ribosomal protein S6 [Helianthus annuus]|nr:putative translation elongation factor EF1B/ribosomal protein S6 [Helianthus annuus]
MAVTFSDLHTESGLKSLESFLSGKTYISGSVSSDHISLFCFISKDDVKVYAAVLDKPSADLYPSASQWYECVASKLAASFPGKAAGVGISAQTPSAEAAPAKEAAPAAAADEDDDDLDLFGDETEEEKKAAEERDQAKASTKKKESGKSSVLMDVKPWDDETDMKKLEEAVRSVELPGLLWGACMVCYFCFAFIRYYILYIWCKDQIQMGLNIQNRLNMRSEGSFFLFFCF